MKTRYILLAFAALAMSACARNVEPAEPESIQMTFTAYQEGHDATKSTVQNGGTQVYWEPGDEIKVFFNGSGGRFTSQNTENATSATFTGTLPVVVGGNEGAGVTTKTWGLYPYRADAVLDGDVMVTTLPAAQTGREGSFAKNTNITLAHSEGYGLAFYNVCGGIRFSLTQEGIKRVTFEGNNGEAIAGKIKIAFEDGVPVVSEVVAKDSVLTLTAPDGGTFQTGIWYYISALPGPLSGGYKMVFYKESESAKLTSSSSVTFKRGIFGSLADADENLIFKPTGDEPNPDDIIQFADPAAKYACVAKFDTDGDGKVSIEEAEAATSFEGLFDDWKGVTSFDEIRYFKNVHSLNGVFNGCNKLVSITIPENISDLGSYAFNGCSSLVSIVLPSGITAIGGYSFYNCSSLVSVEMPSTVTSIGQSAFSICSSLTSIDLSPQLKTLAKSAFSYCSNLSKVIIPNGVTSIPDSCFEYCGSLNSIYIPEGVTRIGRNAFHGVNMWKLTLPTSIEYLDSYSCGSIFCVLIPSTSPVSCGQYALSNVEAIFVPSDMLEMYSVRTNFPSSLKLHPIDSYKEKEDFILATEGAVDMGTSVKWAAFNVGATQPNERGELYAWGETETKSTYSWSTYLDSPNRDGESFTKYYNGEGGKTTLDPDDDVAHIKLGGKWRMPTDEEWNELMLVARPREFTTYEGKSGLLFYSFENGNLLFFPYTHYASGYAQLYYWSSSLYSDDQRAQLFKVTYDASDNLLFIKMFPGVRYDGLPVRPVCE